MHTNHTIAVGEFKAKCLQLISKVHDKHQSIIITKRGQPYAVLQPIESIKKPFTIFGCMEGTVKELDDVIAPIDVEWDAQK